MSANEPALLDPFAVSAPDEAAELTALVRTLELAEGFQLIFARCNQFPQRERLMEEVRSRLPKLNIQTIFFREPIQHLLDSIQEQLMTPLPDVVFVSGLEFSLPITDEAQAAPLIANLNASRNSFAKLLSCPVVFWIPEYVLSAIANGAPDFFSIRSSVYFFATKPTEIAHLTQNLSAGEFWKVASLPKHEKQDRIAAIERLLSDYKFLPDNQRDRRTELKLIKQLGEVFYAQGNYDKALTCVNQALNIAEELDDEASVASSLHQLGVIQQERGNYEEAQKYYERSLQMTEELGNKWDVASSLHQVGRIQQLCGNYEEAQKYYERSLQIREELGDKWGVAISLHQLGVIQQLCGNYEEAQKYYERSLQMTEELGNKWGVAISLGQLGNLFYLHGNYEEAQKYYERSLQMTEELGNKSGVAISLGQLGQLRMKLGDFDEAFPLLLHALSIFAELQSPNAGIAMSGLRELRGKWDGFDATWQEDTGKNVPEWLLQDEEVKT